MTPAMTKQQAQFSANNKSALKLYQELAVGNCSLTYFAYYEIVQLLLSGLPGIAGLGLRSLVYPSLLARCGKRPGFSRGITLRNPRAITIGNKFLLDDYAVLDVRGDQAAMQIGDHVCIGKYSVVLARAGGKIVLADGVNISSHCRIASQSQVTIGESTLIAAYCYIGPGNHREGDSETPLIAQEMDVRGGVKIGSHTWIGTKATILDGVTIGNNAIVGAHSLVRDNVPDGAVVAGTPAKFIRWVKSHSPADKVEIQ